VKAIYAEDDLPQDKTSWIVINADKARALPVLDEKQPPFPGADERRAELGY
jgi:ferredoxin